ncbi:MAG: P-loop NTPase, partial [Bdellovibrionales bacterium]|nr:P-loop NTPase [Bdellovibrionales bacterium]
IIWRGPMFNTAMRQMFEDVAWGEVDYCIVDMPPGTGDAQISLAQNFSLSGAVVVTTPQEVALADVRKVINMLGKVNVEVLGIVENMAGFVAPDGSTIDIFGSGGGAKTAEIFGVPLLAQLALYTEVREGGDTGLPIAASEGHPAEEVFARLAMDLVKIISEKAAGRSGLQIVNN